MRVCKKCHSWVHKQFHNDTLAKKYNTEDKLMEYVKLHGFPEPPKRTPTWRKSLKNRLKREDYELQRVINKMVKI